MTARVTLLLCSCAPVHRVTSPQAKKFLAERSAAYMTARGAQREMASMLDSLPRVLIPRLPCWIAPVHAGSPAQRANRRAALPQLASKERAVVDAWKRYIKWEEENPLLLEDLKAVQARVTNAYRRAAASLQFYPEIWYNAYLYYTLGDNAAEALKWLEQGLEHCPDSFLLSFARVEHGEKAKATQGCAAVFEKLIEQIHSKIDARQGEVDAAVAALDAQTAAAEAAVRAQKAAQGEDDALEGDEREALRRADEGRQQQKKALQAEARSEVARLKEEAALVWIKQMQFLRRTEGLRPMRMCFGKARKSPHATWHVYEASALMEYHCSKEVKVAINVFELAMKTFGPDEALIVRYLDFLLYTNDENNARALFERTITAAERARPVWDRWADYEYNYGDSAAIAKLESRLAEAYPEEPQIHRLNERNSYGDIEVVAAKDLGHFDASVAAGTTSADRAVADANEGVQAAISQFGEGIEGPSAGGAVSGQAGQSQGQQGLLPPQQQQQQQQNKKRGRPGQGRDAFSPVPSAAAPGPGPLPVKRLKQDSAEVVPDAIRFFLSMLPMKNTFNGPLFRADDIVMALMNANLPPTGPAQMMGAAPGAPMQMQQQQVPGGQAAVGWGRRAGGRRH